MKPSQSIFKGILLLGLALGPAGEAAAQGNQGAQNLSSTERSGQSREGGRSQTAQVGAGTTNGATTGFSGSKDAPNPNPGEVQIPPLPSPELCQSFQDTPAYRDCLSKVLSE